ncbi:MAG: hypothetical protein IJM05_06585 [Bacteroidales bacterium]|nr:hypothetical protein [Bacteroidales bacterium]
METISASLSRTSNRGILEPFVGGNRALVETDRPRKYWSDLKRKLLAEGSEVSEKIGHLKMKSADGKMYATDVADQEQLFSPYLPGLRRGGGGRGAQRKLSDGTRKASPRSDAFLVPKAGIEPARL